jgi:hypothetical protein
MFWIVPRLPSGLTLRGQGSPAYLPPLPGVAAPDNSISSSEIQFLIPAAQLICWSHGASDNPQNSHDNDPSDVLPGHILGGADPLLVPMGAVYHEESKCNSRNTKTAHRNDNDMDRSVRSTDGQNASGA